MKLFTEKMLTWLGRYGIWAIIIALGLKNLNIVSITNPLHIFLNISAAIALITEVIMKKDSSIVFSNIAWSIIAILSLIDLTQFGLPLY